MGPDESAGALNGFTSALAEAAGGIAQDYSSTAIDMSASIAPRREAEATASVPVRAYRPGARRDPHEYASVPAELFAWDPDALTA
jgi:hypothetical protein